MFVSLLELLCDYDCHRNTNACYIISQEARIYSNKQVLVENKYPLD